MANLQSLQMADYSSKVQKSTLPVILDFGAEWCSPCKRLAPILETLAAEWSDKAVFYTIDADTNNDLVSQFRVMSLPTLVLVKNGKEVARTVGLQNREKLVELISSHL
jgi:thioredoxin 1